MRASRLSLIVALAVPPSLAHAQDFADDFESYANMSFLDGQGGWGGWDGVDQTFSVVNDTFAFDGTQSVSIVAGADTIQEFDLSSGLWTIACQVYVPSGNTGEHWLVYIDEYNQGGPYEWGGQIEFDSTNGTVECDGGGYNNFVVPLITDAWVEVRIELDLDLDYAEAYYNGALLGGWVWSTGPSGNYMNAPIGFEALDLWVPSGSTGAMYIDAVDIHANDKGIAYCDETQNPSNYADLSIDTLDSGAASIVLTLTNGPPSQFTYLIVGDGNATVSMPPGAVGDLCVAGGACLGRYAKDVGPIDAGGSFTTDIQNALSNPCNGAVDISPGKTWNFQYWHRQPMGQLSTFSHALSVTFQ